MGASPSVPRLALVLGSLLAVAAVVWLLSGPVGLPALRVPGLSQGPGVGMVVPDVTLQDLGGRPVTLSSFRGRAVLVNFWATWCVPCRAEMPEIQSAYHAHEQEGLVVLGINLQEDAQEVQAFQQELGITFPLLLDQNGDTTRLFRLTGLPTSFFIDRQGVIRDIQVGAMSRATLDSKLARIL